MLQFHDRVGITNKRKLPDGRMVVDARFARAGIYEYAGHEVDPDNLNGLRDSACVRVYRPPAEVFDEDSMRSFAFKAVTDDHPPEMVDAANWSTYSKGLTDGQIKRDGDYVRVPMMLADAGIVAKVDAGKSELSAGYGAELTFGAGETPDGERYDAVMTTIRGNHIAVVDRGRAGAECRIADATPFQGATDMTVTTKTIHFDGLPVVVTDAGEAVIVKLQGLLKDAGTALETANKTHTDAIAAKDGELGERDATITDLKTKVLEPAALDKLVTDRAALFADVKLVAADLDTAGKDAPTIRRDAVLKALGDTGKSMVDGKSDDYVQALFDGLVARAKAGGDDQGGGTRNVTDAGTNLIDAIAGTLPGGGGGKLSAYDEMKLNKSTRWQSPDGEQKVA